MTTPYALGNFSKGDSAPWSGIVRDGQVIELSRLIADAPNDLGVIFANWSDWMQRIDDAVASASADGWHKESDLIAHLPYRTENLFGAGANYRKHVVQMIVALGGDAVQDFTPEERKKWGEEMMDRRAATGKPYVWIGLRSAIAGPNEPLILPYDIGKPDWELELAVVIGKEGRRIRREDALSHIAGYTIANDITARDLIWADQKELGMDLLASKSAGGFHIIGPYITPARFVQDPQKLHVRLSLNDQVMQDEMTDDMIFDIARMIQHISDYATLYPGDILMTGSPAGNGTHYNRYLQDGDVMVGEIKGILGKQVTHCRAEPR